MAIIEIYRNLQITFLIMMMGILLTDINVRLGIGTNTPRAKLDVDGDLRVSGIPTFKDRVFFDNDIVISGSAEYTGVSTFSDADVSDLIVTNITVRNKVEINSLNVGLNQITYEGTLLEYQLI